MKRQIYLDNSATTQICDDALDEYIKISREFYGNPSSLHTMGAEAERLLNASKQTILYTIGDKSSEVIFTSSGSEANNLAIIGHALSKERYKKGAKIITSMGEHASVNEPISHLQALGYKTAAVSTRNGELDFDELERELTPDTVLLSLMMVNNETGAVYDLPRAARILKSKCPDALFHVDATQGYLKIPFTKSAIGADLITLSAHKIEGPKGVGALVIDKNVIKTKGLTPIVFGGGQGLGLRSGTENVPAVCAFAKAAKLGHDALAENIKKMNTVRDYLVERLTTMPEFSEVSLTLPASHAPHILNITLPKIKSETMLHYLSSEGLFVSSGSACSSNSAHISSALTAYGRTNDEADCSIRISFGHRNTKADVDAFTDALSAGLTKLSRIKR